MIFGEAVRLAILYLLFGSKQGGGGGDIPPSPIPGPMPGPPPIVPPGPFPSPKPQDLPPWPNGWCPDVPPPPEVVARAWALLPTLWVKGENTRTVEMTGGRWITYVAMLMSGVKGVAAYRTTDCEPVAPPVPVPVPPMPAPPVTDQALVGSAITMNEALKVRGYKQADMVLYQDFQQKAGLKVDGYPGTVTMLKLETVLQGAGQTIAPVKIYPWKATGGYDGVNAPTSAEWEGVQVPPASPIATPSIAIPPTAPPVVSPPIVPVVSPSPLTNAWTVKTNQDVQHALNVIGYGPLTEDGIIGPLSKGAVVLYQKDHPPLSQDGIPGPQTKAALSTSIANNEHRGAPSSAPSVVPAIYAATSAPTTSALSPATSASLPVVSTNVQVQHALNVLGYKGKDGKTLTEDGSIGPNSKAAVLQFQKEHPPLAQDSIPGPQTKAALSAALGRLSQAA